jgi:hypothetical protein
MLTLRAKQKRIPDNELQPSPPHHRCARPCHRYQERQKTAGIEINVDKSGISIEAK